MKLIKKNNRIGGSSCNSNPGRSIRVWLSAVKIAAIATFRQPTCNAVILGIGDRAKFLPTDGLPMRETKMPAAKAPLMPKGRC